MTNEEPPIDIESFLAGLQPPRLPDETAAESPGLLSEISAWGLNYAVNAVAGLLTEPSLHANDIRLEWLQRLIIAKSRASVSPPHNSFPKC